MECFGRPIINLNLEEDLDVALEEYVQDAYLTWIIRINDTRDGSTKNMFREEYPALSESARCFYLQGHGRDVEDHLILLSATLVEVGNFDGMSIAHTGGDSLDRPVVWSILFHAEAMDIMITLLEQVLGNVRFLVHCDVPDLYCEDDDEDVNILFKRTFEHPKDMDEGSVGFLGIDIDLVVSMLPDKIDDSEADGKVNEGKEEEVFHAMDLLRYIRPVKERLELFNGSIESALHSFQVLQYRLKKYHMKRRKDNMNYNLLDDSDDNVHNNNNTTSNGNQMTQHNQEQLPVGRLCDDYESNPIWKSMYEEYLIAKVKVVDLGNACWTYKHFTDDIQTRQYRSPEVILGARYDTSADMWSLACITFELLTGDLLFDPHAGKTWDRDEDHLAMMSELLGGFSRKVSSTGKYASEYFNRRGELRHISNLKFWCLRDVLFEKYHFSAQQAKEISDFMDPILQVMRYSSYSSI